MALLDVKKCYECVDHVRLADLCYRLELPTVLIRVSINSYRWRRHLILEESTVSFGITPSRGIAAGSIFACFEVAAYVLETLQYLSSLKCLGRIRFVISIHVDDLQLLGTSSNRQELVHAMKLLFLEARLSFAELGLIFAVAKGVLLATTPSLARLFLSSFTAEAGTAHTTARSLGADMQLSGKRQLRVQATRFKTARLRRAKLRMLHTRTSNSGKVFRAGVLPSVDFGAELSYPSASLIRGLRSMALKSHCKFVPGGNTAMACALEGLHFDPAVGLRAAPLVRYHREIWMMHSHTGPPDLLGRRDIDFAFAIEYRRKDHSRGGPLGAAFQAMAFVGWRFLGPYSIVLHDGSELDLCWTPPALLTRLFALRHEQVEFQRQLYQLQVRHPNLQQSYHAYAMEGRTFDYVLARKTLRSKALTSKEKYMLRCWWQGRLPIVGLTISGLQLPSVCCHCGQPDSIEHRLCECRGCPEFEFDYTWYCTGDRSPPNRYDFASAAIDLDCKAHTIGLHRGLLSSAKHIWRPGDEQCRVEDCTIQDERVFAFEQGHTIFTDGSCFNGHIPQLAVAGFAILQVDEQGVVVRKLQARVPHYCPQTASFSEFMAMTYLGQNSAEDCRHSVYTDCQAVLNSFYAVPEVRLSGGKVVAGLTKAFDEHRHKVQTVLKVKAHQTTTEGLTAHELWLKKANEDTDAAAREAATMAGDSEANTVSIGKFIKSTRATWLAGARRLACWPYLSEIVDVAHSSDHQSCDRLAIAHNFVELARSEVVGGFPGFVCSSCFLLVGTKGRHGKLSHAECVPMQGHVARNLRIASMMGHDLYRLDFDHGRSLFACKRCGAYARRQFRGLLNACPRDHKYPMHRKLFVRELAPDSKHEPCTGMQRVQFPTVWDPANFDLNMLFKSSPDPVASHSRSKPVSSLDLSQASAVFSDSD